MRLLIAFVLLALAGCVTMQGGLDALSRGDLDAAERDFTAALNRGDTMAWNNLGVVYQRRGQTDRAIANYTMAARWGHQIAQQNLINLGAPVPPADLAAQDAQSRAATAAAISNLQRALNPPRPVYQAPQQTNCRTVYSGNVANTQCY